MIINTQKAHSITYIGYNQHTGLPAKMTEVIKHEWEAELNLIYEKIKHQETILLDDEDMREIQEILKLNT